jgi:SNF2 family DNA or RNA helicase
MDGSIKNEYRQSIVNEFQNNPDIRLFIGMLDVQGRPGGMGWTLTAASCTATLELQWGPLIHKQADDRVHRISQKNAVINYYLLAKNTIEERIAKIQDQKLKIANAVIDGEETDESSLLFELMKSYE